MRFLPHKNLKFKLTSACFLIAFLAISVGVSFAHDEHGGDEVRGSVDVGEIKQKIADRNSRIEALEAEIAEYKEEVSEIAEEKQTLKGAIRSLDISRKQITTDIVLTENKIGASELKIQELELQIKLQEEKIDQNKDALKESIKNLNEAESQTLVENFLAHDNLSEFWNELESLERFKSGLRTSVVEIAELKSELEKNKHSIQENVDNLEGLRGQLASKRGAIDANRSEKNELLEATANEEERYQALIAEKEALREAFLTELKAFESQLDFNVDPSKIPESRSGTLIWPIDAPRITQYFGNTPFASTGAYNGNGHNGIDFGTPVGTPVKSALSGVVEDMGDTDLVCPNASYGKWVLVRHYNGLSSLYAHLSGFSASKGQEVATGQIIGYSGNTGFSTGPHLHFTVFASDGVKVLSRPSRVCGGTYTMPVADFDAYQNPLNFL